MLRSACILLLTSSLPIKALDAPPIQDNSFLIEEAYNQEAGVVQHISTFQRFQQNGDWMATFTQEWPVPDERHQLSFTLPYARLEASPDGNHGFGDIALNYRYQLLGNGASSIAIAPRFTLTLPAGNDRQERGNGAVGYQGLVPISLVLGPHIVTHVNLGATYIPRAKNSAGDQANLVSWTLGQSVVWLATPRINPLLEVLFTRNERVIGPGVKERADACFVNPGLRWAIPCANGLQIVPGFAIPMGVGPSRGERAIFLYLSFEAPMWKPN